MVEFTRGASFLQDRLSQSTIGALLVLALLLAITVRDGTNLRVGHRLAVLILSLAGVVLAALANDLVLAVVAMELASLPATGLLFVERDMPNARAAAVRSLSLNLFALALLIAGAVLIGLASGTSNLDELRAGLPPALLPRHAHTLTVTSPVGGQIGCVLLLAGLGVHLLCVPFQLAAAEIFDGAKSWGIALTAVFPRGAALVLMIRLLVEGPPRLQGTAQTLFTAVGFVTVLIASVLALWQAHVRRLVAYLVLFQSGLLLVALAAACAERVRPTAVPWLETGTPGGIGSACFCFVVDSLALIGFLALVSSRESAERPLVEVHELSDAMRGHGVRAVALCVLVASLAGIPPFPGFWARLAILRSTLSISVAASNGFFPHQNVDYVVVALAVAGGLILLAPIVLGLVKQTLLDESDAPRVEILHGGQTASRTRTETTAVIVGLVATLAIVVGGAFPEWMSRVAARETFHERAFSHSDLVHPADSLKGQ